MDPFGSCFGFSRFVSVCVALRLLARSSRLDRHESVNWRRKQESESKMAYRKRSECSPIGSSIGVSCSGQCRPVRESESRSSNGRHSGIGIHSAVNRTPRPRERPPKRTPQRASGGAKWPGFEGRVGNAQRAEINRIFASLLPSTRSSVTQASLELRTAKSGRKFRCKFGEAAEPSRSGKQQQQLPELWPPPFPLRARFELDGARAQLSSSSSNKLDSKSK